MIVRPDGTGARLLATEVAGIVGWSPDGASVAYAAGAGDSEERELHVVTIADGADLGRVDALRRRRILPSRRRRSTRQPMQSSRACRGGSRSGLPRRRSRRLPLDRRSSPTRRGAGWCSGRRLGEFDCYLGVLRFPDQFTVIDPQRAGPPPGGARRRAGPRDAEPAAGRLLRVARQARRVCGRPSVAARCVVRHRTARRHGARGSVPGRGWPSALVAWRRLARDAALRRGRWLRRRGDHATGWLPAGPTGRHADLVAKVIASSPWHRMTGRSRSGTATARISGQSARSRARPAGRRTARPSCSSGTATRGSPRRTEAVSAISLSSRSAA